MLGRCGERYTKHYLFEPNPQNNNAFYAKKRAKVLLFFDMTKFFCNFLQKK